MAAIDLATLDRWRTLQIVDRDGGTVGSISEFYLDRETRHPTWALVNVGLFGARQVFVPLLEATEISDGIQVPYEKGHIKDAPRFDLHGELTPQEEAALAAHYGIEYEPVTGEGAAAEAPEAGAGAIGAVGGAGAADAAAAQEAEAWERGAEGTGAVDVGGVERGAVEAEATEGTGATAVGAAEAAGPGAATGPGPAEDDPRADEQASAAQDERAAEWERAENGDPAQARATDDLAWPASPPPPGPITEPPGEPPEVTRADRDR